MKSALREYQQELYLNARESLKTNRSVCLQLATGGGKTVVFSAICESVYGKNKSAWIVVPRNELLNQASAHLKKWKIPHGIIGNGLNESRAYKIHVVSKDTLIRRFDKIKNWPDLMIFDECHLYLDKQIEIISYLPEKSKIIGFTATPERLDGRGLSTASGGLYDSMIEGPSIPWLTDRGFLVPLEYYAPPLEGLDQLKRKGNDLDEEQLEDLLQRRKVYGEVVSHWERYGKGKQTLGFCRSVKAAYQMAERFRDKGYNFHCIEGNTKKSEIKKLLDANRNGTIDGICTADLVLYGVDIPRVEYGFSVRPTLSFSLFLQMIGRIIRPYTDPVTGRKKESAIWMDHVNMLVEHGIEVAPGNVVPPHYAPHIKWNFDGIEKRKRNKTPQDVRMCPHKDFMYCSKPSCIGCEFNPEKSTVSDARKSMIVIPTELEAVQKPLDLKNLPMEEQREIQDEIGKAVLEYRTEMSPGAIGKMLEISEKLGYKPLWVYYKLTPENKQAVNFPLLHEIARQKNFKTGWCHFASQKIRQRKGA